MEAIAAGTGASISVAALARRWFRAAVRDVVDERLASVNAHLDRQDKRLQRIEEKLNQRR